jgi:hypothetical protein
MQMGVQGKLGVGVLLLSLSLFLSLSLSLSPFDKRESFLVTKLQGQRAQAMLPEEQKNDLHRL